MNTTEAHDLLVRLLGEIAPDADLTGVGEGESLQDALDLDSMDFLNLMEAVHDAVGLDVPERDYPALSTVRGFVTYVTLGCP